MTGYAYLIIIQFFATKLYHHFHRHSVIVIGLVLCNCAVCLCSLSSLFVVNAIFFQMSHEGDHYDEEIISDLVDGSETPFITC